MKLKKRMLSILLALAVMITFMPTVTLSVHAASKSGNKVYTVSSEKNEIGDNTKYTYNKKGFVTKAVSKYTKRYSDSDSVRTVTTTFKYNKKNRITTKTTKDVEVETFYKTSNTTGKSTGQSLGTVTTTTTDVTNYTYKKGRAVQAVTTSTVVKSGSQKEEDVSLRLLDDDEGDAVQLSDGRFIAGYNYRNPDGTETEGATSDNAYYYTGDIKAAEYKGTGTTTYKDNGDGTYTQTYTYESNSSNFNETPKRTYYKQDENGKYVTCTEDDDWYFYRTDSVEIAVGNGDGSSSSSTSTDVIKDQTVTTTNYQYDGKKRVKRADVTSVSTTDKSSVDTSSSNSTSKGTTEIWDEASDSDKEVGYTRTTATTESTKSSSSVTETNAWTETYKYDKKNRKVKTVVTDNGVENRVETSEEGLTDSTEESTTSYADGKTRSSKEATTYSGTGETYTTVCLNGNRATTVTKNPYSCTYTESYTSRSGNSGTSEEKSDYTFFKNGGRMTTTVSKNTETNVDGSKYESNQTSTRYRYDETGEKYSASSVYESTSTDVDGTVSNYKTTEAVYNDGTGEKEYYYASKYGDEPESVYTDDAALKATAESANKALTDSGTPFTETKNKAVKATPSTSTTTYKYDKQGNLKSAKTSGSNSEVCTLRNETYGNTIFEYNEEKNTEAVETVVAHTYNNKALTENTVKNGTNRVASAMTVRTSASDRSTPSYGIGGRVTYKLKAKSIKKKAVRKDVELQQWMIQNPGCGSVVGL